MPTAGGKPKVGERIRTKGYIGDDWIYGVVLQRVDGIVWGLKVRWDDGKVRWLGEAGSLLERGRLEVVE